MTRNYAPCRSRTAGAESPLLGSPTATDGARATELAVRRSAGRDELLGRHLHAGIPAGAPHDVGHDVLLWLVAVHIAMRDI